MKKIRKLIDKMRDIDHRSILREPISNKEQIFFNKHLPNIREYYKDNAKYWEDKSPLNSNLRCLPNTI